MRDHVTYKGKVYRAYFHHKSGVSGKHPATGNSDCIWERVRDCPS